MKTFIEVLCDSLLNLYGQLTIQDPCKRCLVKACCSEKCEILIEIEKFIFPNENIKTAKKLAWLTVFSIIVSVLTVITVAVRV